MIIQAQTSMSHILVKIGVCDTRAPNAPQHAKRLDQGLFEHGGVQGVAQDMAQGEEKFQARASPDRYPTW